jgi:hypothetical protein
MQAIKERYRENKKAPFRSGKSALNKGEAKC